MADTKAELQSAMLRALALPGANYTLWEENSPLWSATQEEFGEKKIGLHDYLQMLWSLLQQGLIYFHPYDGTLNKLHILLTDFGQRAARDEQINPDYPSSYIQRLKSSAPGADSIIWIYATEAHQAYLNGTYLACAVMLGVASEAAFLDLARSFVKWLHPVSTQGKKLDTMLNGNKDSFNQIFEEFRKRLDYQIPAIRNYSRDIAHDLARTPSGVINLLRVYRNDAGHPTGKQYDQQRMYANLNLFDFVLGEIYELKSIFDNNLASPNP